jgi:hypothetical protein
MSGHHLPNCVIDLWVVTEGLVLPQEAQEIRTAIDDAVKSGNPKGPLNRAVARLKRRNGGILAFCNWLASIRNEFEKRNLIHSYSAWQRGFSQIRGAQGTTFHQAFGMDNAGRRSSLTFSYHDNLAVYFEDHARKGTNVSELHKQCETVLGSCLPDDRTIRWNREKYASMSDDDIAEMANFSKKAISVLP